MEGMETCPCVTALYLASNRCPPCRCDRTRLTAPLQHSLCESPCQTIMLEQGCLHTLFWLPPLGCLWNVAASYPRVGLSLWFRESETEPRWSSVHGVAHGRKVPRAAHKPEFPTAASASKLTTVPSVVCFKKIPWSSWQSLLHHL